jgi:hypothetical protein
MQRATAQIVYTDISDQKVCAGSCACGVTGFCTIFYDQSYLLDLDNAGGADFKFSATAHPFWGTPELRLKVIPLNGSEINANIYLPYVLRKNKVIGPTSSWSDDTCTFVSLCISNLFGCVEDTISEWRSGEEAYLGVKIIKNSRAHYGWVRLYLNYSASRVYCIIKDYAYQQTPDQVIKAGITGSGGGQGHGNGNGNNSISTSEVIPDLNTDTYKIRVFPNPAYSVTTISFKLEKSETVRLHVYDITGQLVKTIVEKQFEKGLHSLQLNATDISAGTYFLRLQTGSLIQTSKLVFVK